MYRVEFARGPGNKAGRCRFRIGSGIYREGRLTTRCAAPSACEMDMLSCASGESTFNYPRGDDHRKKAGKRMSELVHQLNSTASSSTVIHVTRSPPNRYLTYPLACLPFGLACRNGTTALVQPATDTLASRQEYLVSFFQDTETVIGPLRKTAPHHIPV